MTTEQQMEKIATQLRAALDRLKADADEAVDGIDLDGMNETLKAIAALKVVFQNTSFHDEVYDADDNVEEAANRLYLRDGEATASMPHIQRLKQQG